MRLRPLAASIAMLALICVRAPLAIGDDSKPPVAVIQVAAKVFPSGVPVFLDASASTSDFPIEWTVEPKTKLVPFDQGGRVGVIGVMPAAPDDDYVAVATAGGIIGGKPVFSTYIVKFRVGKPPEPAPPKVDPDNPAPPDAKPLPTPANQFQSLGQNYAKAMVSAYAATWDESITMFAAGSTRAEINSTFAARCERRRTAAFAPVAAAFATVAPDAAEPVGAARDALGSAFRQFVTGIKNYLR